MKKVIHQPLASSTLRAKTGIHTLSRIVLLPLLSCILWFPTLSYVQAQLVLNCPPNISTFTSLNQCSRTVNYATPTTNATQSIIQTFNYTGNVQTFTVPNGVTSISIRAYGAQGRRNAAGILGGRGGYARGNLSVSGGNTLYIYVGGGDIFSTAGGYNGGGKAGGSPCAGALAGGGGGASDVRLNSTSINARRIVAGGGGGAGGNRLSGCGRGTGGGGGGGRYGGGGGAGWPSTGGTLPLGGTQSAGGAAGTSSYSSVPGNNGTPGALGLGGGGGDEASSSQGGSAAALPGGFGGGIVGDSGRYSQNWTGQSGAGGSGYVGGVTSGAMANGARSGNGVVQLSYTVPVAPTRTGG
ncbi:MAG TPA: hypothetical protein ENJ82_11150, partial [Bacteroidetes bacterium]|nr:hypothetical protein [Bacteroidota bacterium]